MARIKVLATEYWKKSYLYVWIFLFKSRDSPAECFWQLPERCLYWSCSNPSRPPENQQFPSNLIMIQNSFDSLVTQIHVQCSAIKKFRSTLVGSHFNLARWVEFEEEPPWLSEGLDPLAMEIIGRSRQIIPQKPEWKLSKVKTDFSSLGFQVTLLHIPGHCRFLAMVYSSVKPLLWKWKN